MGSEDGQCIARPVPRKSTGERRSGYHSTVLLFPVRSGNEERKTQLRYIYGDQAYRARTVGASESEKVFVLRMFGRGLSDVLSISAG